MAHNAAWCVELDVAAVDNTAALATEEGSTTGTPRPTAAVAAGGAAARSRDAVAALCLGAGGPTGADDDPSAGVADAAAEVNVDRTHYK